MASEGLKAGTTRELSLRLRRSYPENGENVAQKMNNQTTKKAGVEAGALAAVMDAVGQGLLEIAGIEKHFLWDQLIDMAISCGFAKGFGMDAVGASGSVTAADIEKAMLVAGATNVSNQLIAFASLKVRPTGHGRTTVFIL